MGRSPQSWELHPDITHGPDEGLSNGDAVIEVLGNTVAVESVRCHEVRRVVPTTTAMMTAAMDAMSMMMGLMALWYYDGREQKSPTWGKIPSSQHHYYSMALSSASSARRSLSIAASAWSKPCSVCIMMASAPIPPGNIVAHCIVSYSTASCDDCHHSTSPANKSAKIARRKRMVSFRAFMATV